MKKLLQWGCVLMAVVLVTAFVPAAQSASMADETAPAQEGSEVRNDWIDENLGPGVARWVDENGNVSEQTGKHEEESSGADSQSSTEEQGQQEAASQESQEQVPAGRQIDPARPMVALTFDDGPFAPVGNQIMDCLAQYGGKATFFVVGNRAAAYQTELQRMVAEGHEIGNHTYEHKYLTKLNGAQIQNQINRCNDAVQAVCGVRPTLVRLPGGLKNGTVLANVQAPMIMWSIDTLDWKTRNAGKTVNAVLSQVRDGDIVLMHELYSQSGSAALEIIPRLTEAGYQLVTVSEMAQLRGGAAAGGVYSHFYP
ncbi:polysaccharide deacetylase family protein [Clostridium sp. Marseille-P2415]|uniref:polysaccharide deacetylase family protein n=1 Tax=Clostridium sp. Marseille-P2415 TaxID=1805471 RepID=UPI00098883B8|nr:polysaccharide deacetylase family protein [Clostridium sp. Marseille-P2415]